MLDVRRLRVLSEVAARGSFSAAAVALRLTQSAVSQHVAALEREVGLPLVERGTRPIELTEAGHALTRHATGIFARLDGAEQELGEIAGRRHGRLRFGSFPTALATIVPPAFARSGASTRM
jgi:DNA-binding transcriptional LysR family regulator